MGSVLGLVTEETALCLCRYVCENVNVYIGMVNPPSPIPFSVCAYCVVHMLFTMTV